MITCTRCGGEMPELRLTRFGYDFCIKCSQESPRIGRVVTMGEGDHTWNEIEFIDPETARRISEFEKQKDISHLREIDLSEEDVFDETIQEIKHKLTVKEQDLEEDFSPLEDLEDIEEDEQELEELYQEDEEED